MHDAFGEHVQEGPGCWVLLVVDHLGVEFRDTTCIVPSGRLWHPSEGGYLGDVHLLEGRELSQ